MLRLYAVHKNHLLPLLIEADGSRQRPLKAPAAYEPVIPEFVEKVIVVAGLAGLGKPLKNEFVHRPEIYAALGDMNLGEVITPDSIIRVLTHPSGGMKNIPSGAHRVALINQADTPDLQAQAKMMAGQLLSRFDEVISASLNPPTAMTGEKSIIHAVFEPVAGVILAGGGSTRFGQQKQLLDWHGKPFVRCVAETAINAGLSPVVVVTGAQAEKVEKALTGLNIIVTQNLRWQTGQSSSIRAGLSALSKATTRGTFSNSLEDNRDWDRLGAAVFLLTDQPQVTPTILRALSEEHARTMAAIVAPLVRGERANPVLFDRSTFPELMMLKGDVGGRAIFSKVPVNYLTWHDESLLADVDTADDYRKLVNGK
jgi:molybdenum cofactor cytidylyltransferase